MADLAGSIFIALKAIFDADTGAGGLNEATDTGVKVRHFIRRGDPNFEVDRTYNWPMLVVEVANTEDRAFGGRHANVNIRMHLFTNRDANTSDFTIQDAVGSRMYALFDGAAVGTQGGFTFAPLNQLRDFQAPSSGTELHRVFEYSLRPML